MCSGFSSRRKSRPSSGRCASFWPDQAQDSFPSCLLTWARYDPCVKFPVFIPVSVVAALVTGCASAPDDDSVPDPAIEVSPPVEEAAEPSQTMVSSPVAPGVVDREPDEGTQGVESMVESEPMAAGVSPVVIPGEAAAVVDSPASNETPEMAGQEPEPNAMEPEPMEPEPMEPEPMEPEPPAPPAPAVDRCDVPPLAQNTPFEEKIRIPLRIHTTRSRLSRDELCSILGEINTIWWDQAGICFEMQILDHDRRNNAGLDMWYERSTPFPNGVTANGVFAGLHEIFTLDTPRLNSAPNPAENFGARTGAHELGHALNLSHQNCGTACNDLLMRSGRQGFKLLPNSPADTNELTRARNAASQRRLRLPGSDQVCAPPHFDNDL